MACRARLSLALTLAVLTLLAGTPARAQYFGQNKVRYEAPQFHVLKTEHFDIYYDQEEKAIASDAATMAERWYARISAALDHQLSRRQPLILYPSHPAFEQTNAVAGDLSEGIGGVTESFKRRIVLPIAGSYAETDHVIGHELVHAFQYDIAGQGRAGGLVPQGIERLPLWFVEGMAEYLSIGPSDPHTAMWMRDAASNNKLPNYGKLADPRFFPYRFGQALWAFVAARYGEDAVGRTLKSAGGAGDAGAAIRTALGTSADSLIREWHAVTKAWSAAIVTETEPAAKQAAPVIVEKDGVGRLNLAPAVSPDGKRVVFLSERSRFAVEMYIADAATGKIERQITKTVVDPHFQSIQFVASAGDWSPDGQRFAFAAVTRGRPLLTVIDVRNGRTVKEHRFDDLGEILTPSWSPDGRQIVFSALTNGTTDLWVVDVATGTKHRLTNDRAADLQPSWSPDGKSIAFVTDRFDAAPGSPNATDGDGASISTIADSSAGPTPAASLRAYRIALIDPETGHVREVPGFGGAKHIDPHWSGDGASLFFVSDRGGISDLYRVSLPSGALTQITHLTTGVSGLTSLSPAFSVARSTDRLVFSAYEKGSYNLYRLDGSAALAGSAPRPSAGVAAGELPPIERSTKPTAETPGRVAGGDTTSFKRSPYRASLSLDNVSQVSLGIAGGSTGTHLGGGAAFYWSDMLGDHNLATAVQFLNAGGSFINNTGAIVGYSNMKSRWNWGAELSQIPYVASAFTEFIDGSNGDIVDQETRYWEIDRSLLGMTAYPFNRFRRLELNAGLRNITFTQEVETRRFDLNGVLVSDNTVPVPGDSLGALNLATFGGALVFDNSVFGGTGPVLGQRYRFEVDPVIGSLNFTEVLADYRRYIMLARPLGFAGRVLHFGRYGSDGEDNRLSPLFIGYPSLVRGYDINSFTSDEQVFDHLLGSRIAVANAELRLPLLGGLGIIPSSGFPPLESAIFFDAGSAWGEGGKPSFLGGDARTVTSHGVALRLNLFGFAVGELDFVHPNDRPGRGWYWELSLQPGF